MRGQRATGDPPAGPWTTILTVTGLTGTAWIVLLFYVLVALGGPASGHARVVEWIVSLFWAFSVACIWFTRRRRVGAAQAASFGACVGVVGGILLGLEVFFRGHSPWTSDLVGITLALLGSITLAGWLAWWYSPGGREQLIQRGVDAHETGSRRTAFRRALFACLLLGVIAGGFVGCIRGAHV